MNRTQEGTMNAMNEIFESGQELLKMIDMAEKDLRNGDTEMVSALLVAMHNEALATGRIALDVKQNLLNAENEQ